MDLLYEIRGSIYSYLFIGIYISIIFILIAKLTLKKLIDIEISLNIIRIALIIHSIVSIMLFISTCIFDYFDPVGYTRLTGPYWWAYSTMMILNTVLPLTLLIKKLGNKKYYLLLVSILINSGWIFESFVIHMVSMKREYIHENPFIPRKDEILVLGKGLILGIIILLIGNLFKMKKENNNLKTNFYRK